MNPDFDSVDADRTGGAGARVRRHILARLLQLGAESHHLHRLQPRLSTRLPQASVLLALDATARIASSSIVSIGGNLQGGPKK